jgi:putative multiple sugar transport system substrate-binding protein
MKKFSIVLSLFVIAATVLSACGTPATPTTAVQATQPAKLSVGVVLPTKDEPRWIQDETRFNDAFKAAGYDVQILFSQGDSAKEKANVESLISQGVKVIIICPQDASAAAAAADEAKAAGVKVISYDRLIRDSASVDYYVTFDSISVGKAQAQYLVDKATGTGNPLYLYAGAASDNNAFLFFEGAWDVLQPKIADGTFVIKNSSEAVGLQGKPTLTRDEMGKIIGQVTTDWKFDVAKNLAQANLTAATAADKGNVFILAPNDGTSRSIADTFAADKDVKSYVITGQDAEEPSIQYIIDGKQSMTVLKDVRTLVGDAITAAIAYLSGGTPEKTTTYNNGKIDVPAKPTVVVTVDKSNVKAAVIDSGYWPASDFKNLEGAGTPSSQVEVFSWWVGPGEADGLAAMVKIFQQKYPNDQFVNAAVAGGAGTNAKAVLATRLSAGDPPDSWQAHAGEATFAYVDAKQILPLDEFFASSGFAQALPAALLPLISKDGHPYSVPVNIHRSNVMWYNPKVLSAAGVTMPAGGFATYDDFFAACEKVKAAGKTCLALGPAWTAEHLFENVMIGTLGADGWNKLWLPGADWSSADVTKALNNYAKALSYTNSDAATLSDWQPAAKLMIDGDAAFNIMGDWAYGYFANPAPNGLALKPHTDFDWVTPPGTNGIFVFLADSFVLPVGNKNPQGTKDWLAVAASKEGQEAFNPLKGSICARTDCDPSLFSEYSQGAAKDWSSNKVVGSLTHEVVGNPSWNSKVATALGVFVADPTKVADFQTALVAACKSDGACK